MVLRKDELEVQLKDEHKLIQEGVLKDDSPLDASEEFGKLCEACRIGDLKGCQEAIATGVNLNARDQFDYTPLILASLCGHYEVVQLLLESGALCERDTFQGERCLYNALNNRIRNLLLQYDYSKSADPLQPLASHITSLLTRQTLKISDITLTTSSESWNLHKLVLSARSPYFEKKLSAAPETTVWKLASSIPPEAFQIAIRFLYLSELGSDLGLNARSSVTEEQVFKGIDKISKQLEIESLWQEILAGGDRRIARQRHQDEITRGRDQIEAWYRNNVLKHKIEIESSKAHEVKWVRDNGIFADVLLRADEDDYLEEGFSSGRETPRDRLAQNGTTNESSRSPSRSRDLNPNGIPIGPSTTSRSPSSSRPLKKSVLFPVHRAMLLRSDYFQAMFASKFKEAEITEYLHIVTVDCSPEVLEIILDFLYTEEADIPLNLAVDVLFAADMLFIEKLKTKAAIVISTIGNGTGSLGDRTHTGVDQEEAEELINVYDIMRAGWITRVQRLEEFSARYIAYRLEDYVDEPEFEELVRESASRIRKRQATDTIELVDDIRYYLSERFRLRFEDSGFDEMIDENGEIDSEAVDTISNASEDQKTSDEVNERKASAAEAEDMRTDQALNDQIRTLDGEVAGDEFAADAINYQVLLGKIDALLDRLKLDA